MKLNSNGKYLPTLLFTFSFFSILCAPKETVIEDCRKFDTCPITYATSIMVYPEDENGSTQPSVYLNADTKITILTDKDGKIQSNNGSSRNSAIKVLLNGKEIYLQKHYTTYETELRSLEKKGTILYSQPDKKSTFAGNLPFNSVVKVINQNGPIDSPSSFLKIVSGNLTGWSEKRFFTDGNYDAALHNKKIDDLVNGYTVNAVNETEQITIAWADTNYANATCQLTDETCLISHSFGEANFGKKQEALNFFITKSDQAIKYKCQIRRIDFIDAYVSIENKTLSPYLSCDRIDEEQTEGYE